MVILELIENKSRWFGFFMRREKLKVARTVMRMNLKIKIKINKKTERGIWIKLKVIWGLPKLKKVKLD